MAAALPAAGALANAGPVDDHPHAMPRLTAIGFDADDTLWENEINYHAAKRRFAALLSPTQSEEHVLAALDEIEVRNVEVYGYGIKSYSLSMLEAAARLATGPLEPALLDSLLAIARDMLRTPVELIDGVVEVLNQLTPRYRLVLLTKGDLFEQQSKIRRSGIADRFAFIRVLHAKTPEVYREALHDAGAPAEEFVMVGNSLRSDVLPALAIGAQAIFIPHALTWSHEHVQPEAMPGSGWIEIDSIAKLPAAIQALEAE
jgi:putative hydrolase of the HAD superfamily